MPKNGSVAVPGLVGVAPGSGVIIIPPVSVCHHVSTIGHFSFPIILKYHNHTSGFIASPTVPKRRNDDKSKLLGINKSYFMYIRNAVGVVYRIVALCFSTSAQYLSGVGKSGVPSKITFVTPCNRGA